MCKPASALTAYNYVRMLGGDTSWTPNNYQSVCWMRALMWIMTGERWTEIGRWALQVSYCALSVMSCSGQSSYYSRLVVFFSLFSSSFTTWLLALWPKTTLQYVSVLNDMQTLPIPYVCWVKYIVRVCKFLYWFAQCMLRFKCCTRFSYPNNNCTIRLNLCYPDLGHLKQRAGER